MHKGNMDNLSDTQIKTSLKIDDCCDWSSYLAWQVKSNYRRSNSIHEPAPARPQVASVRTEPKKKSRKRGHERMLPTMLISNLTPQEMSSVIGERLTDRMVEGDGATLIFNWPSYRSQKGASAA